MLPWNYLLSYPRETENKFWEVGVNFWHIQIIAQFLMGINTCKQTVYPMHFIKDLTIIPELKPFHHSPNLTKENWFFFPLHVISIDSRENRQSQIPRQDQSHTATLDSTCCRMEKDSIVALPRISNCFDAKGKNK